MSIKTYQMISNIVSERYIYEYAFKDAIDKLTFSNCCGATFINNNNNKHNNGIVLREGEHTDNIQDVGYIETIKIIKTKNGSITLNMLYLDQPKIQEYIQENTSDNWDDDDENS